MDARGFQRGMLEGSEMIRLSAICLLSVVVFAAAPAWAQTTNQLFMTGTSSGNAPVLYTNGVDTNINLSIMPKGNGYVGIGTATPAVALDVWNNIAGSDNEIKMTNNVSGHAAYIATSANSNYSAFAMSGTGEAWYAGEYGSTSYELYDATPPCHEQQPECPGALTGDIIGVDNSCGLQRPMFRKAARRSGIEPHFWRA
jgi:hypothetical protein